MLGLGGWNGCLGIEIREKSLDVMGVINVVI